MIKLMRLVAPLFLTAVLLYPVQSEDNLKQTSTDVVLYVDVAIDPNSCHADGSCTEVAIYSFEMPLFSYENGHWSILPDTGNRHTYLSTSSKKVSIGQYSMGPYLDTGNRNIVIPVNLLSPSIAIPNNSDQLKVAALINQLDPKGPQVDICDLTFKEVTVGNYTFISTSVKNDTHQDWFVMVEEVPVYLGQDLELIAWDDFANNATTQYIFSTPEGSFILFTDDFKVKLHREEVDDFLNEILSEAAKNTQS